MWIIWLVIGMLAFVGLIVASETVKENKELKSAREAYRSKNGCYPEETIEKIRTSPNVDILVNLIAEASYPNGIEIHHNRIYFWGNKSSISYRSINIQDLPPSHHGFGVDSERILAEAIHAKLSPQLHYVVETYDYLDNIYWRLRRTDYKEETVEKQNNLNEW